MAEGDELTIDEAFSDPLIRAVMTADNVDPAQLRREWVSLIADPGSGAAREPARRGAQRSRAGVPAGWDALVRDCLCAASKSDTPEGSRRTGTW